MVKKVLKKCIFLAKYTFNTSVSICRAILFSKFSPSVMNLRNAEQTCYILGNGPSLKEVFSKNGISWLNRETVFVVNDFVLSDEYEIIKPAYYIFADPGYWSDNTFEEMIRIRDNVFDSINKKTTWKMNILIPYEAFKYKHFQKNLVNPNIKLFFFNTTKYEGFESIGNFLYKRNIVMPQLQNVLVGAIYIAINLNFKEINLLGAEHSWLSSLEVNSKNEVCLVNKHFYDPDKNKAEVWLKSTGEPYLLHEILVDLAKMFSSYHLLQKYAVNNKAIVYNCTKHSFIDSYERKNILKA